MNLQPVRYVVLHHTGIPEPHFDLMIEVEAGERLRTWRLKNWPAAAGDPTGERLKDHRAEYLNYEGPISDNRGEVRRVAGGVCSIDNIDDETLIAQFDSTSVALPRFEGKV